MNDCDTLSYQCKIGDHRACGFLWIGAPAIPPGRMKSVKVMRMICRCDCGHKEQKAAERYVRSGGRIS